MHYFQVPLATPLTVTYITNFDWLERYAEAPDTLIGWNRAFGLSSHGSYCVLPSHSLQYPSLVLNGALARWTDSLSRSCLIKLGEIAACYKRKTKSFIKSPHPFSRGCAPTYLSPETLINEQTKKQGENGSAVAGDVHLLDGGLELKQRSTPYDRREIVRDKLCGVMMAPKQKSRQLSVVDVQIIYRIFLLKYRCIFQKSLVSF